MEHPSDGHADDAADAADRGQQAVGDETGDAGAPSEPGSTDEDGTPVENPAG